MPKIPTPAELGLGPSQTPTSTLGPTNINVPDLSVGAQQISALGRALTNMYQDAAKAHIIEQGIEDERILMETETKLADLRRDALFGEGGLMTLEKGNAIGASEKAAGLMTQWADQFERAGLSEAGRDAMDAFMARQEDSILDTVARHEMNQRAAHRNAMLAEASAKAADEAKYWYADADMLAAQEAQVRANFDALLAEGATDEAIAANEDAADRAVARMYADTILHAVGEGGGDYARPMLQELITRGVFKADSEQTLDLMRIVAEDEREGVVQHLSERIWIETDGNLEQALLQVDAAELDGETKKDLKADIERRFSQREDIEKRSKTEATHAATLFAYQGNLENLKYSPDDAERATYWNLKMTVDSDTWQTLLDINAGYQVTTDPHEFNRLHRMSDSELMEQNLSNSVHLLSTSDYRSLLDRQRQATEGLERTNRAAISGTMETYFNANDVGDSERHRLTLMVEEWAGEQDRAPTAVEVRAKLTEYRASIEGSGGLFDRPEDLDELVTALNEVTTSDQLLEVSRIGTPRRDRALAVLARVGMDVSYEAVMSAAALIELGTPLDQVTQAAIEDVMGVR